MGSLSNCPFLNGWNDGFWWKETSCLLSILELEELDSQLGQSAPGWFLPSPCWFDLLEHKKQATNWMFRWESCFFSNKDKNKVELQKVPYFPSDSTPPLIVQGCAPHYFFDLTGLAIDWIYTGCGINWWFPMNSEDFPASLVVWLMIAMAISVPYMRIILSTKLFE